MAGIGSSLSAANATAAASTTAVIAAAEDEVSAAIASLFSGHGQQFQALSAQAAAFHAQFVQALNAGAGAYASSEAANAGLLQTLAQDLLDPNVAVSLNGITLVQLGTAHATSRGVGIAIALGANSDASAPYLFNVALALGAGSNAAAGTGGLFFGTFDTAIAVGTNDVATAGFDGSSIIYPPGGPEPAVVSIGFPGSHDTAIVVGTGSTATAGAGNNDLAAVLGNMQTATATGGNHLTDIVTPFGTAGGAAGLLVPNVAVADPSLPVPNVSVSAGSTTLLHLGTASTYSTSGGFAVAVGANSNASATGPFNSAFALGAGSNATTDGLFPFGPGIFDTAIAVGTNDVATAGAFVSGIEIPVGFHGSFDTAFVLGTGSTALAGATNTAAGNHDLAAVVNGDMLTATATGANRLVDIVTPLGTL